MTTQELLTAIRAEIKRRIAEITKKVSHIPCHRIEELESLLSWLDSPEKSDTPINLDEAADAYAEKHGFRVPYDGSNNFYDEVDVKASKEGYIAGWLARDAQIPKLPGNVDEAAEKYANYHPACFHKPMVESFKAGAEWAFGQGETNETRVMIGGLSRYKFIVRTVESFEPDEWVIVQIRKK